MFYGWWIVAGGFILQALAGGLLFNSFGAYFVYLQSEFGWSRTLIASAFSFGRLGSGGLGPVQGWLINRLGPRAVVRIGTVLFGCGFVLFSQIQSLPLFYVSFLLLTIGASLAGFLTVNITLANWFERQRARAFSLGSMGQSSAGLLVPLVAVAVGGAGWRATAFASGLLIWAIGLPVAQLFRAAPEPYGLVPDGRVDPVGERPGGAPASASGLSAREALRNPAFWLLTAGHTAALFAVSSMTVHLIPYLVEQRQTSVELAATVVAALTASSVVGQLVGGHLGDRREKRVIATAAMVGHTAAMLVILASTSLPLIVVGACLHGLSWGMRGPLMMAIRADYFGRRAFATIEGFASMITPVGLFLGPVVVGLIADQSGDYRPGFAFVAAMTTIGFFCFLLARRPVLAPVAHAPTQTLTR